MHKENLAVGSAGDELPSDQERWENRMKLKRLEREKQTILFIGAHILYVDNLK